MAKNYYIILFSMICLVSCNSRQERQLKYDNGNLKESYEVIEKPDGSFFRDGVYKTWYENGQISVSGIYKDNQKSGKWTTYYRTGAVKEEGTYEHNEKSGKWNEYAENGQVLKEYQYRNGSLSGLQQSWYENGQKKVETHYLLDKLDQYYKMWNEDGSVRISCKYKLGKNLSILGKWVLNEEIVYKGNITKGESITEKIFDSNGVSRIVNVTYEHEESYTCNFDLDKAQIITKYKDLDNDIWEILHMSNEAMTLTLFYTGEDIETFEMEQAIDYYKRTK